MQASGSPIGNPNMTPQKYPSREISEKTNAKLVRAAALTVFDLRSTSNWLWD